MAGLLAFQNSKPCTACQICGKIPTKYPCPTGVDNKLEDLKVPRRSPDLFDIVKIGQGKLQLIMKRILFYQPFWSSDPSNLMNNPSVISVKKMFK